MIMAVDVLEFIQKIEKEPALQQGVAKLLEAARSDRQTTRMSYDEFLEWADEDTLAEWVNGEVIMSSPASLQHQKIEWFLATVLGIYTESRQLGVIITAPFQMKLEDSGREPDLLFLKQDHLDRLKTNYLDGPADLAVEIISPESIERDRGTKFIEYESAGVLEYWLIDPIRSWTECYLLNKKGRYETVFAGYEGVYHSTAIPGFWLKVEWISQTPLPSILEVIRELKLIE
jgi:Uma2 family endonuclease